MKKFALWSSTNLNVQIPASDGVKNLSLLSIGLAPNVYHNNLFIDEMYSYF